MAWFASMQTGNLVLPYTKSIASSNSGKMCFFHRMLEAFMFIIHEIIYDYVCYLNIYYIFIYNIEWLYMFIS